MPWPYFPDNRPPWFDSAFALAFTGLLLSVALVAIGIRVNSGALIGISGTAGICCIVIAAEFGLRGAIVQRRSVTRSLVNGYRRLLRR